MAGSEEALRSTVRYAYERGRLRFGMRAAPFVGAMMVVSWWLSKRPSVTMAGGGLLLAVAVLFRWWGGAYGRAVMPGLLAGVLPLVLPLLLRSGGHCCIGGICWSFCMVACIGGGLVAGAIVGRLSANEEASPWKFLGAATLVAMVAGTMGCAVAGLAGTAGMASAILGSSLPTLVFSRRALAL